MCKLTEMDGLCHWRLGKKTFDLPGWFFISALCNTITQIENDLSKTKKDTENNFNNWYCSLKPTAITTTTTSVSTSVITSATTLDSISCGIQNESIIFNNK